MKRLFFITGLFFLFSCSNNTKPDISGIEVNLNLMRFDQDFFAIDTTNIESSLAGLKEKYPEFLPDYFENILGLPWDSTGNFEPGILDATKNFIHDYYPVKDSSDKIFKNFSDWQNQITEALRYVRFYFPGYNADQNIITFIGPFDAFFSTSFGIQGDVLTREGLGVGLQLHLGKDYSFFRSDIGRELYPDYISANFNPEDIPIDCMKNVVDDLYPPSNRSASLIEKMVSTGKRYYLLTKFLPDTKDNEILDYTSDQMKAAYKNEAVIWDFFLNNGLLNSTDPGLVQNYIGPSPTTQEFGTGSPGNLGSFAGLQIVRKYMEKYPETSLQEMMNMPPREIYEKSKYKPRA